MKCLPLLWLLALPAVAPAQFYYTNSYGIWAYTPINGPVTILGNNSIPANGVVVVPDTINGYPVTSIGGGAFYHAQSLTSVTIPDSVTSIGSQAFIACSGLTDATIGNGVINIGNAAFFGCSNLASITIPASVANLGAQAFENCIRLMSVAIPNSVTSIGDDAFLLCSNLASVTLGNSVTNIGLAAFADCSNLTSVTIPASVISWNSAFANCTKLGSVTLINGLTSIGSSAFENCTKLSGVAIPNSVTSIGGDAFADCTNLANVTIGTGVTNIGDYAFYDCLHLTSVAIPDSVTSIGDFAFEACISLTGVTFGTSVINIGDGAFVSCSSLTNAIIPMSVTSIGADTFASCLNLSGVTIPSGVTSIGHDAFASCKSLATVDIPDTVTNIGEYAFFNCLQLRGALIGNGITSIANDAFEECTNLGSVNIPNGVLNIGDYAFNYCLNLTNVTIGNSVTNIGEDAFDSCNLTSVIIPNSVTTIADDAFIECSSLTNITVGSGVTSIGPFAFSYCPNLKTVYFQGNSPAPTNDLTVFQGEPIGTVYYLSGTTGWGALFDGWPTSAIAATNGIGSVVDIHGGVTVTHVDGSKATLHPGDPIQMGDRLETDANGMVQILFVDNTSVKISINTKLTIDEYVYDPNSQSGNSSVGILRGIFEYNSGLIGHNNPDGEHIHSGYGYLGIRGTQFIVQQDPCSSNQLVYLIQGELAVTPRDTPSVTNICYAPVTISITPAGVTTNALDQATYNSISNQVFQSTGIVTFPLWAEQYFDCTNDPAAAPTADLDGDGQDNYTEFLAGMNPTNNASAFHILSTTPQANDMLVRWMCGGGRTNVLQTTTNLAGTWFDVSPNIVLAGSGASITNFLDVGAATNNPARFYRVKLVQ